MSYLYPEVLREETGVREHSEGDPVRVVRAESQDGTEQWVCFEAFAEGGNANVLLNVEDVINFLVRSSLVKRCGDTGQLS